MVLSENKGFHTENIDKIEIGKEFIKINKLNYFGFYNISENKKYIVSWLDCSEDRHKCGRRNGGKGTYILCEDESVILKGKIERPNEGKVGNNGNFIFEDWLFNKDGINETGSICYGFNKNGRTILKHYLNSNIRESAISDDGNFAIFQTGYNESSLDGNKLYFFDLKENNLLWDISIKNMWPEGYIIKEHERIIYLDHGNGYKYKFDFDGNFLDEKIWDREKLDITTEYKLYILLLEELNKLDKSNASLDHYDDLLPYFNKLLRTNVSNNIKSFIYKEIAIIDYKKKNLESSLANLKLSLNYYSSLTTRRLYNKIKEEHKNSILNTNFAKQ
ncbi:hypothetical protein [Methanobrevibacter filiformis]|uniref:Uncharacterized protein n=1 Tax=Methanobrevibacter filiformis TaxID=55758 RepID=A0A166F0B9_9EURY|nr:hypothetical protein [Methanobrevibacter filiformis]KZX17193.1 hypothetical protein MBFIL_03050 [Methanobrevibacter filiformis]